MIPNNDWEVICYSKPEKLLQDLETQNWDALITDYNMPGMNGYDLARLAVDRDVKVIMMTANRKVPELHPDINDLVQSLLFKPFKRNSLLGAIQALS